AMPAVKTMDAPQRQVVAVSSLAPEARVFSTVGGITAAIDDRPSGTLGADGLAVGDLQPGIHGLTIGEGKNLRKMSFTVGVDPSRSEEHTSELQSRRDLVCRLLLEKKKDHVRARIAHASSA